MLTEERVIELLLPLPSDDLNDLIANTEVESGGHQEFLIFMIQERDRRAAAALDREFKRREDPHAYIIRGVKYHDEYGEGYTIFKVYPPHMTDDEVFEHAGFYEDRPFLAYSPSGRMMRYEPRIRRTGTRVLITQYCARDV